MTKSGFYKNGKSHEDGGIPVLVDGSSPIEVEQYEYKLCNNAINSTKIFEFKDKTNKEILDNIFQYANCEFKQNEATSGDFIICKLAVLDKNKRDITGTPKEIINIMQSEKSCNVTNDTKAFKDGGIIPEQGTLYTRDKKKKLEYIKNGSDYEFIVYEAEENPVIEYTRNQYKSKGDGKVSMNYNQFVNYLFSETYIDDKETFVRGGEIENKDETYTKWKNLVNMSKSELKDFYNSSDGKKAGLSASEAKSQGIDSGRESARWIMKMKETPKADWTSDMWRWAKKQISFISRMSGMKGDLYDDKGNKTRKHTSLLIWGHNPKKYNDGGSIKSYSEDKYDDNGNICYWKTYTLNNSSISIDYCLDNFFKIDAIVTKEKSRRGGDASKLIDYVKEIAVKNNFQKIDVYLPIDENTPRKEYSLEDYKKAVSFYKKNGFKFYKNSTVKMFIELKTKENENTNGKTEIDTSSNKLLIEKAILYISEGIRTAEKEPREYKKNELIDLEAKLCYNFAVANKLWITDIDVLGLPLSGGGNENELYYEEKTGIISKVNNLLNHGASVLNFLKYIQYHNLLFEANSYNLIGFTGFDNEANNIKNAIPYVMPIISQIYVTESVKASINEIKKYMQIIGFEKVDEFTYKNSEYIVSDLRPRNVLKDSEGNIHVIDNIIKTNEMQIGGEIIEIKPALEDVYNEYWFRSFSLNSAKMDLEIYSAISTDNKDRYFKIRYIGIDELEKRKGYATKLLNKAKELALKTNYDKIDLTLPTDEFGIENYTSKDYNIAVSFYKKNGFEFYTNSTVKMFCDLTNKYNNSGEIKTKEMENKNKEIGNIFEFTSKVFNLILKPISEKYYFTITQKEEKSTKTPTYELKSNVDSKIESIGVIKSYIKKYKNIDVYSISGDLYIQNTDEEDIYKKIPIFYEFLDGSIDFNEAYNSIDKQFKEYNELYLSLQKGIAIESEHEETAEKLYNQEITPDQAAESIAKEHLAESPKYYDELEKMESKLKTEEYKSDKIYTDIKSCLIEDGDDENSYIFEGKEFINKESGRNERWKIISFFKYGVNVSHLVNFKLTNKSENEKLTFDEIRKAFKDGLIEIHGIESETTLNNCLKLLSKCIDIVGANDTIALEIAKHDLSKQEIEKLKSKILEIEEKSKKEVEKLVEPIEIIEPETINEIEQSSEQKEFKEAINTFEELIKLGGTGAEIKEWQEAIETLKMLL